MSGLRAVLSLHADALLCFFVSVPQERSRGRLFPLPFAMALGIGDRDLHSTSGVFSAATHSVVVALLFLCHSAAAGSGIASLSSRLRHGVARMPVSSYQGMSVFRVENYVQQCCDWRAGMQGPDDWRPLPQPLIVAIMSS